MNCFQEDSKELSKLRSEIVEKQEVYCKKVKQVLENLIFNLNFHCEVSRIADGRIGKLKIIRKDSFWGSNPYVIGFFPIKKNGDVSRVADTYYYIDDGTIEHLADEFVPYRQKKEPIKNDSFKRTGRKVKPLTAEQIAAIQFYLSTPNASYSKCGERIGVSSVTFGNMVKKYIRGTGVPKGEIE